MVERFRQAIGNAAKACCSVFSGVFAAAGSENRSRLKDFAVVQHQERPRTFYAVMLVAALSLSCGGAWVAGVNFPTIRSGGSAAAQLYDEEESARPVGDAARGSRRSGRGRGERDEGEDADDDDGSSSSTAKSKASSSRAADTLGSLDGGTREALEALRRELTDGHRGIRDEIAALRKEVSRLRSASASSSGAPSSPSSETPESATRRGRDDGEVRSERRRKRRSDDDDSEVERAATARGQERDYGSVKTAPPKKNDWEDEDAVEEAAEKAAASRLRKPAWADTDGGDDEARSRTGSVGEVVIR